MATSSCAPIMASAWIGESAGPREWHHRHQHPALARHPHHRGHHGHRHGPRHHHHHHQDLLEPEAMPGHGPLRHHHRHHHRGHAPGHHHRPSHARYLSPRGHGLFHHHSSPGRRNHHARSTSPVRQILQHLRLQSRSLSPAAGAPPQLQRASSVPPHHGRHGSASPRHRHHWMVRAFQHGHRSPPALHAGPHHQGLAMRTSSVLGHHHGRAHPHPHGSPCRLVPDTVTVEPGTHPLSRVNRRGARGLSRGFGHRMNAMARSEDAQRELGAVPPEASHEEPEVDKQEKMVD